MRDLFASQFFVWAALKLLGHKQFSGFRMYRNKVCVKQRVDVSAQDEAVLRHFESRVACVGNDMRGFKDGGHVEARHNTASVMPLHSPSPKGCLVRSRFCCCSLAFMFCLFDLVFFIDQGFIKI